MGREKREGRGEGKRDSPRLIFYKLVLEPSLFELCVALVGLFFCLLNKAKHEV